MLVKVFPDSIDSKLKKHLINIYGKKNSQENDPNKLKALDQEMNNALLNVTDELSDLEIQGLMKWYLTDEMLKSLLSNGASDSDINSLFSLTNSQLRKNLNMKQSIITILSYRLIHVSKMI